MDTNMHMVIAYLAFIGAEFLALAKLTGSYESAILLCYLLQYSGLRGAVCRNRAEILRDTRLAKAEQVARGLG